MLGIKDSTLRAWLDGKGPPEKVAVARLAGFLRRVGYLRIKVMFFPRRSSKPFSKNDRVQNGFGPDPEYGFVGNTKIGSFDPRAVLLVLVWCALAVLWAHAGDFFNLHLG